MERVSKRDSASLINKAKHSRTERKRKEVKENENRQMETRGIENTAPQSFFGDKIVQLLRPCFCCWLCVL